MFIVSAKSVISIGFKNTVEFNIRSSGDVEETEIAFDLFKEINNKREIILIVFLISILKSLKMNLFSNIISSFKPFIIIMIFFNNFFNSFKLKKISLLNITFFSNYIFPYYEN